MPDNLGLGDYCYGEDRSSRHLTVLQGRAGWQDSSRLAQATWGAVRLELAALAVTQRLSKGPRATLPGKQRRSLLFLAT